MTVSKETHAVPLQILYRHHNLFHYFPSLTQALEALFVLDGVKPAAQQLVHADDLRKVETLCRNMGLGFASASAGGGWHIAMLADSQELADNALFYAHISNHARLGEALGYPPCCVDNYLDHIRKVSSEEEYVLLAPRQDTRLPFVMNYLLRPHDVALLSHVPCSFRCEPSLRHAERSYGAVARHNPRLADYLQENLRGPVVVHGQSAHPLRGYSLIGQDVYYRHASSTKESYMQDVFSRCDKVQVLAGDHIRLCQGDHVVDELKGDVRFLLFE